MTQEALPSAADPRAGYPRTVGETWRWFLTAPRPLFVLSMAVGAWVLRVAFGGPFGIGDAAIAIGLVAWWPIQEWLIHVHVLHFRPRIVRGRKVDLYVGYKHRKHHRDPLNLDLVFIPWQALLGGAVFHALVWPLVMPTWGLALSSIALYWTLTLHYEWVHYLCHVPYVPRSRFYRRLWRSHRLHHFKNERYWLGVSMLAGDRLFGTAPEKDAVPASETVRTLGVDDDYGRVAA